MRLRIFVRHLTSGEEIVQKGALEILTQLGFVIYKAVLRLGSNAVIWFGDVLNI